MDLVLIEVVVVMILDKFYYNIIILDVGGEVLSKVRTTS